MAKAVRRGVDITRRAANPYQITTIMNQELVRSILALAAAIIEKASPPAAVQVALAENAIHIAEKAKERAAMETDETTVELLNVLVEIQLVAARSSMDTALALLNPAV